MRVIGLVICGIVVLCSLLVMIFRWLKGAKRRVDKADVGIGMTRESSNNRLARKPGREYLSRAASRALDAKMDAEDPRFIDSKYW